MRPGRECTGAAKQEQLWQHNPSTMQLQSDADTTACLAVGPVLKGRMDPWCTASTNMWRSSTDVLQTWGRVMQQVESLVGMGSVSAPGSWAFPDALELGVPGGGVLTWEESKSHFALYAITSSPLVLGNDVRPGHMQPRLVSLLTNEAALRVNQAYSRFAGDRITTASVGKELSAKPLGDHAVAALLFNRNGTTSKCIAASPIEAPCDDLPSATSGEQLLRLDFGTLVHWLAPPATALDGASAATTGVGSTLRCNVTDVYGGVNAASAVSLGAFTGSFERVVAPHGVAFLIIEDCHAAV